MPRGCRWRGRSRSGMLSISGIWHNSASQAMLAPSESSRFTSANSTTSSAAGWPAPPRLGQTEDVLQQCGLVVVSSLHEPILLLLEVERGALLLVEQPLE